MEEFIKKLSSTRTSYIFLVVIIVIGAVVRLQGVFLGTFAFTYDVGRDLLALQSIIHSHRLPLIGPTTGLPGVFYGPWWYYLLLLPFILSRGNPQGIALFIALLGIGNIILGFFIGKKLHGNFLGVLFASFLSFSQAMIDTSSQIWNPNLAPFFVLLLFLLLLRVYQKEKSSLFHLFTIGFLLGLIIDSEIVFGLLFFLSICVSLLVILRRNITIAEIGVFLLGMFVIVSPRIFFDFRHQFLMTRTLLASFGHNFSGNNSPFLATVSQRISFFDSLWNYSVAGNNMILGLVLIVFIIVSSTLFYKKITAIQKAFFITNWIILLVYFIGLTFFSHDIWPHYTVGLPIIFIFLLCMCLFWWEVYVAKKRFVTGIIIFLLLWININPTKVIASLYNTQWEGDAALYRNQLAAVNYIYHEANGQKFKYIVYTPPVFDYTYRYLFSWYGEQKYHYVPEVNKANLFFVLLEPDFEKPFRLTDWLMAREHDGKIIREKVVKGGIRVQTRTVK